MISKLTLCVWYDCGFLTHSIPYTNFEYKRNGKTITYEG